MSTLACVAKLAVCIKTPGILFVVVFPVELDRIHEDGDNHNVRPRARAFDESAVPCVQGSHGRYTADRAAAAPCRRDQFAHVRNGSDEFGFHSGTDAPADPRDRVLGRRKRPAAHFVNICSRRFRHCGSQVRIPFHETRHKILKQSERIVADQDLSVAMRSRANSDRRYGELRW